MRAAMVEIACSSYAEMAALTAKFLGCRATNDEMDRLSKCRSQLASVLKVLGVTSLESVGPSEPTLEDIAREIVEKKRRKEPAADGEVEPA